MTVLIMLSIHRILLDQPQALYCPTGPLGSTPKRTVLAPPTSHPQCDRGNPLLSMPSRAPLCPHINCSLGKDQVTCQVATADASHSPVQVTGHLQMVSFFSPSAGTTDHDQEPLLESSPRPTVVADGLRSCCHPSFPPQSQPCPPPSFPMGIMASLLPHPRLSGQLTTFPISPYQWVFIMSSLLTLSVICLLLVI